MRFDKAFADDDLVRRSRFWHPAHPHVEPIEGGLAAFWERDELACRRLAEAWDIEQSELCNARLNRRNSGNFRAAVGERLRRTPQWGQNAGELVTPVVGRAL